MAKRTNTKKKKATGKRTKKAPEELYLTVEEKTTLLYLDARIKNAELGIRLNETTFREQMRDLKASHFTTIRALEADKTAAKEELDQIKQAVEEKYKIKMSDYTFHAETGLLILSSREVEEKD
jgi:hypothetical protein